MTDSATRGATRTARRLTAAFFAVLVALAFPFARAWSDPQDPVAQLRALARESEQTEEAKYRVQTDLNAALAAKAQAQTKLADDQDKEEKAKVAVDQYQPVVDTMVEAAYNGARLDDFYAFLVSKSPGQLLDQMSDIKEMAGDIRSQVECYKSAYDSARQAATETGKALDAAKAAEQSAMAKKAELQAKEAQLQQQINAVKAKYAQLSPAQVQAFSANPMEDATPPPAESVPPAQAFPDSADGAAPAPQQAAPAPQQAAPAPQDSIPDLAEGGSGARAVQAALSKVGRPYSWGGAGPSVFDCSGLVMWSYGQAGRSLPHSSQAQDGLGRHISRGDLRPGDLVTYYSGVSHVALYIGNGMVVHAPTYGQPVVVVPIDAAGPVHAFVRMS